MAASRRIRLCDYTEERERERERLDELPFMKDLRDNLDDLYAFQAEGAPSWFKAKGKLDHWVREGEIRHTPKPIGEDEDEDEVFDVDFDVDFDVEEQVAAQSDRTYDEAVRTAVAVQEPVDVSKMEDEETRSSATAVGGAKKQSLGSTTKGILAKKVSIFFRQDTGDGAAVEAEGFSHGVVAAELTGHRELGAPTAHKRDSAKRDGWLGRRGRISGSGVCCS